MSGQIVVVEPALVDARGHHAFATSRFVALIDNPRTVIAAGAGWSGPPRLGGYPVFPVFRHNRQSVARLRCYGRGLARLVSIGGDLLMPLESMIRRRNDATQPSDFSTAMAEAGNMRSVIGPDLTRCLDTFGVEREDRVFIPSADAELVLATAEQLYARPDPPHFHLRLMYDDIGCHRTDPTWRSALQVLRDAPNAIRQVHFLTETRAFARAIEEIWPEPAALLPHPSDLPATPVPDLAGAFVVYLAGQGRTDKGGHLVDAAARVLATKLGLNRLPVDLHIQGGAKASYGRVRIEPLPRQLTANDYALSWKGTHAALLLHDQTVYAIRGSGVVCDAVASARPFIFLNGNSLSEWNLRGNALGTEPRPDQIAEAIIGLMDDYQAHAGASAIVAPTLAHSVQAGLHDLIIAD